MQNRILIHLALVMLFALAQIGIATHSVKHIEIQLSESHESKSQPGSTEQHESDFQCPQCIAQSHADVATIQADFNLTLANCKPVLLASQVTHKTTFTSKYFRARAPPIFI